MARQSLKKRSVTNGRGHAAIENPTPPMLHTPIRGRGAWTRRTVGGKQGFAYALSEAHLQAIEGILASTRSMPPQSIERRHFDHPLLKAMLAAIKREIIHGRGVVIIQGLSRFSPEQLERICWGFGTHWGSAHSQNLDGDRLGRVRNEDAEGGYKSTDELDFHCDLFQILALMCVQRAESGGTTRLASSLAIHNAILKARPDLLPALYRGFYYATEAGNGVISRTPVPVFSCQQGQVSCMYLGGLMRKAAELMDTQLPPDLDEAMELFERTAEDLSVEFMLEPGEMVVCHNFSTLHARTSFTDSELRKRYLLRLWLSLPDGRPFDRAVAERGDYYDRLLRGH
jgi:hypothetical protein